MASVFRNNQIISLFSKCKMQSQGFCTKAPWLRVWLAFVDHPLNRSGSWVLWVKWVWAWNTFYQGMEIVCGMNPSQPKWHNLMSFLFSKMLTSRATICCDGAIPSCGIRVGVSFRFANSEWMCSVSNVGNISDVLSHRMSNSSSTPAHPLYLIICPCAFEAYSSRIDGQNRWHLPYLDCIQLRWQFALRSSGWLTPFFRAWPRFKKLKLRRFTV